MDSNVIMNWILKITTIIGVATVPIVYLCHGHHVFWKTISEPQYRRNLRLFDPRSVQEKVSSSPPLPSPRADNLEFVHIPRTGGMAVEMGAWSSPQKIAWGVCHTPDGKAMGCGTPSNHWSQKFLWMGPSMWDRTYKYAGESWLAPPHWLHPSPYEDKDTFCIIRNPYDRIVSEYHDSSYSYLGISKDPRELNSWIQLKLYELKSITSYPGHFLPQHYYVYDDRNHQVITHILRYENLNEEFTDLMKKYGLEDIRLPPKPSPLEGEVVFSKEFLSPETLAAINDFYRSDFLIFGYPMVERPSQFTQPYFST
jgi:Sulfotransferase family